MKQSPYELQNRIINEQTFINIAKMDQDQLNKLERCNVINMMRNVRNEPPLIIKRFIEFKWELIQEITEDERIKYNNHINN